MPKAKPRRPRMPTFATIEEERAFWETHDPADYFHDMRPARVHISREFKARVRARKKNLTFRMDPAHVREIKKVARKFGMGYQTLMRMWILERLRQEKAS